MSLVKIPESQYHASPAVNNSSFKEFLKSPAHYKHYVSAPKEETEEMHFGSVFHARFLENQDTHFTFNKGAAVNDRKTDQIKAMVLAAKANPILSKIMSTPAQTEMSAFATDPETGLELRARFDWISDGIIMDVKTTAKSAKPEEFERTIFNYGYHIQAAWYARVLKLATGQDCQAFMFAVVEKTAPYLTAVYSIKADALKYAHDIISARLPQLKACIDANHFPGYSDQIVEVGLPDWVMNRAPVFESEAV